MATSFEELRVLGEAEAVYVVAAIDDTLDSLFTEAELEWLQATEIPNLQSPISDL